MWSAVLQGQKHACGLRNRTQVEGFGFDGFHEGCSRILSLCLPVDRSSLVALAPITLSLQCNGLTIRGADLPSCSCHMNMPHHSAGWSRADHILQAALPPAGLCLGAITISAQLQQPLLSPSCTCCLANILLHYLDLGQITRHTKSRLGTAPAWLLGACPQGLLSGRQASRGR